MNRADRSERVRALERAWDQHIAAQVAREAAGGGPPPTPLWRHRFIERHCEWRWNRDPDHRDPRLLWMS